MATKTILYNKEKPFLLQADDEDLDILEKRWGVKYKQKGKGYFTIRRERRKHEQEEGKSVQVRLHNEIWEKHNGPIPEGFEVDHINYDTCDNRKENLRLLSQKENNSRPKKRRKK